MSKTKVYVAGAYNDRLRVINVMADVSSHPGLELALDWVSGIDESRKTMEEHEVDEADRVMFSLRDLRVAQASDVFWFLAPDNVGRGCWFESGSVITAWMMLGQGDKAKKLSIASGHVKQSIFTGLFDEQDPSDDSAFKKIVEFSRRVT